MRIKFISPARINESECDLISVKSGKVTVKNDSKQYAFDVSDCDFWPVKDDNPAIAEMTQMAKGERQQPTVPIQFVWHDGTLSHIDSVDAESWIVFENCTVEQIGAVLYVRSKK